MNYEEPEHIAATGVAPTQPCLPEAPAEPHRKGQQGEGRIDGMPVLMPPGPYQTRLIDWETVMLYGRQPKVVLRLAVCSHGHMGARLDRWYNAKKLTGRIGRHGGFVAGWSTDLVREYVGITGTSPRRCDRINLSHLGDRLLLAHVETVTHDSRQRPLPTDLQYSVIRRLEKAPV